MLPVARIIVAVVVIAAFCCGEVAHGVESWNAFRGPDGNGIAASDTNLPLEWSQTKNVDWLVYCVSDDGIAICVEADSGEVVYRNRLGGNFSASPLLSGNRLYFTNEARVTTVVRSGREFEVLAESDLGERTLASFAVVDSSLLIRTANALYRISQ